MSLTGSILTLNAGSSSLKSALFDTQARSQIECNLSALQATQRLVRQQEITAGIIDLAAGETASRSGHD